VNGAATSVTLVPTGYASVQSLPQSMPVPLTDPDPDPVLRTSRTAGLVGTKVARHVATPCTLRMKGLVVPVIHRADRLSLVEIARRRGELVERAKAGRLSPADIARGTITISNLGMYGIDAFNAIVNTPQAVILAVGRISDRVVAREGRSVICPQMTLTLSCDHRVVDGARGAEFLRDLARSIEHPDSLSYDGS
jgi:pyruvate/2-oxoglutarate dehydrogenase complex dihydrolipoamide acyltransferase (E2) component